MRRFIGIIIILIGTGCIGVYVLHLWKVKQVIDDGADVFDRVIQTDSEGSSKSVVVIDREGLVNPLREEFNNNDIIGFIVSDELGLKYPIVHSKDNKDYLNTDLYGRYSASGSIFLDKDCKEDFSGVNSCIYGHHMNDGSMFGRLERTVYSTKVENLSSIYIYLANERLEYKPISSGVIPDTKENGVHLVYDDGVNFYNWVKGLSTDFCDDGYKEWNTFLTLVTCHYTSLDETDRYGLVCKYVGKVDYKEESK